MENHPFTKAGILTLVLVCGFFIGWEIYWRSQGFAISYNDDESLWAAKRAEIYAPAETSTVFIGSSRIKFDLDLDTWEKSTREKTVQLALVGTSPQLILQDLANDVNFRGKVVIGVTDGLFFRTTGSWADQRAQKGLDYYKKLSLAQQGSFLLNQALESNFVFLEKETFSLSALLDQLELPSREDIRTFPIFPIEFVHTTAKRQTCMTDMFLQDTSLVNKQRAIWMSLGPKEIKRGIGGDTLAAVLDGIKTSVDKIKARGGKVVFLRAPSTGPIRAGENVMFPRQLYWDRLLTHTNSPGIHFEDYPELAKFDCPEWSHLSPADATIFTRQLIALLQQDRYGNFLPKSTSSATFSSR